MSPDAAAQATPADPVRLCAECRRAKSIRGVWYIVPGSAGTPFVCETCFSQQRPSLRGLV